MADCLNEVVLAKTSSLMQKAKYISIACDKVTTSNSQSRIRLHACVMQDYVMQNKKVKKSMPKLFFYTTYFVIFFNKV